jgi:flagellar assembly protein FliH
MTSSTDAVRRDRGPAADGAGVAGLRMPELRPGTWARLERADTGGDEVTDLLLDRLTGTARASARAQGYAVGWAEGRRDAEAEAREETRAQERAAALREERRAAEHAAAVAALRLAAEELREQVEETCLRVDAQASALALELVQALVGTVTPDPAHVLARVTGLLPEGPVCSVHLHPEVAAAADGLRDLGLSVVADPALGRADAVVHGEDHLVDLRVDEALARLREVLG